MLDLTPNTSASRDALGRDESATSPFVPHPIPGTGTASFAGDIAHSTPHDQHIDTAATYPTLLGYQVVGELGDGGMGKVYQAFEPKFNRWVAVKVLRDRFRLGDPVAERFRVESQLLAQLDHPNVVRVYAVGESGGRPFYAMKYMSGGSLDARLAEFRVTAGHAVRLIVKLARAVQYLHDRGVWHRDLKPQNVLLDEAGEPLVADFGVAKWLEGENFSVGGGCVGTFAYMAPEMIRLGSGRSGHQADVWSLGVILYELLAGDRPFPGHGSDPLLPQRVVNDPPPPLAQPAAAPGIDEHLERIVLKALAKDPAHRYASAAALAADLEAWAGNGTVTDVPSLADARRHAARDEGATVSRSPRARRLRVAIPTAIATAAAVFALAWARRERPEPLPNPDPPALTFQQAWARDGDVTVVDGEGKLRFPLTPIPGSIPGVVGTDSEGVGMTVSGIPLGLYEIGALRPPFRFTAKVYHVSGDQVPFVGLYARRKGVPALRGEHQEHDFFALTVDAVHGGNGVPGKAYRGGIWLDPNLRRGNSFLSESNAPLNIPRHVARGRTTPRDYRALILDVYPDHASCQVDGKPWPPLPWEHVEMGILAKRFSEHRPDPKPRLGDGFGLIAANGTAAFRDVRICPIP